MSDRKPSHGRNGTPTKAGRGRAAVTAGAVLALLLDTRSSAAVTPSARAGYEISRGPAGEESEAALGLMSLDWGGSDLILGVVRFDHRSIGSGLGGVVGGGLALAPMVRLRVIGSHFVGDQGYRALRMKAGPVWNAQPASIGIFYTFDGSNLTPDAHGVTTELGLPLAPRLEGKVGASYARVEGTSGYAGSAGISWTLLRHLELSGELGLTRNIAPAGAAGPRSWRVLDPLLDRGAEEEPDDELSPTSVVSARLSFP